MPKTKDANEKIREKTIRTLLQAAIRVFVKYGYHASTMAEIAKKAKVSKGLAYHYFRSKEELLVNIAKQRLEQYRPLLEGLENIKDPTKRFHFFITFIFDELKDRTDEMRFYNALYLNADGVRAIREAMKKYKVQFDRQLIAEEKLLRDLGWENPALEATFLRSIIQGIALEYMLAPSEYPIEKIKKKLLLRYIR